MSITKIMLVSLTIITIFASPALAEMPEGLKGTWTIGSQASIEYMKTSPKWRPADEKHLPTMMQGMSHIIYKFNDDTIIASLGGMQQSIPVVLKEKDVPKYVFEGTVHNQTVIMTVSFVNDTTINIRSSTTDDMDYYLWKRQ